MYMRRSPWRAMERSWYSRCASCTARALLTSVAGKAMVACKKRLPVSSPSWALGTATNTRTRTADKSMVPLTPRSSSSPSMLVRGRWLPRRLRSTWALGRSGLNSSIDSPAEATATPALFHSTTSLAPSWSRMRSSTNPAPASDTSPSWVLALRVLLAMSLAMASRVTLAKFTPAVSAPSTLTSNQLSIERETNW